MAEEAKGLSKVVSAVVLRTMGFAKDLARIGFNSERQFNQFATTLSNQTYSLLDITLKAMLDEGYITQTEYDDAMAEKEAKKMQKDTTHSR